MDSRQDATSPVQLGGPYTGAIPADLRRTADIPSARRSKRRKYEREPKYFGRAYPFDPPKQVVRPVDETDDPVPSGSTGG